MEREDTGITLGTVLVLWGATVAAAAATGVLARFDMEEIAALAIFATLFALGAYALDAEVRAFATGHVLVIPLALALDAAVAFDAALLWRAAEPSVGLLPHAFVLLFVLPLAAASSAAAMARRAAPRALRSRAAKSPGARPAAT